MLKVHAVVEVLLARLELPETKKVDLMGFPSRDL